MSMKKVSNNNRKKLYIGIGCVLVIGVVALVVILSYFYFNGNTSKQLADADPPPEPVITAGPDVMFIEPANGKFLEVGESLMVKVLAQDIVGVVRIDLWINDTLALSLPSPDSNGITPLILTHPLLAYEAGTYSLFVRAYNSRGGMTESPAVTVWVNEQTADESPEDDTILYVVQEGDTIEIIANKTGSNAADIQAANPGIQNVAPGKNIAIPHPPLPAPPAQPPAPNAGGNMGALPGLLPAMPIGGLPDPGAPVSLRLAPHILPDPNQVLSISPAPINAPVIGAVSIKGCTVQLGWSDESENETGFAIYRRQVPNEAVPKIIRILPPGTTSYDDSVPFPGEYQYSVEAQGQLSLLPQVQADILQIQQAINTSRSAPITADVKPDADCIEAPGAMKHIYFEIDRFYVNDPEIFGAALWFSINDNAPRRVPQNQGSFPPPSYRKFTSKGYVPLPASLYLNPDQHLIVKIWAAGHTDATWVGDEPGPINLGISLNSHAIKELEQDGGTAYYVEFGNGQFGGMYHLTLTDDVWGGDYTSAQLSAPTLRLGVTPNKNVRLLEWDWVGDENLLDGYVIYRSYSCIGQETEHQAPLVVTKLHKKHVLPLIYEPQGCSYRYHVTALSRLGESKPSNAITGETEDTYGIAYVTFKDIKIKQLKSQSGTIDLQAGRIIKRSNPMWLQPGVYTSVSLFFNGQHPNNLTTVVLNPAETLNVSFSIMGTDGYICSQANGFPVSEWSKPGPSSVTLVSNDGNCEVTFEISGVPPAQGASGQRVLPQTDLTVTGIASLGKHYYINVMNNGPQDLRATRIGIFYSWGIGIRGETPLVDAEIDGPYNFNYFTVDIHANHSNWIHLGDDFDDAIKYFSEKYCKDTDQCYNFVHIKVTPLEVFEDKFPPGYIDSNQTNNLLRIKMSEIRPMQ